MTVCFHYLGGSENVRQLVLHSSCFWTCAVVIDVLLHEEIIYNVLDKQ